MSTRGAAALPHPSTMLRYVKGAVAVVVFVTVVLGGELVLTYLDWKAGKRCT